MNTEKAKTIICPLLNHPLSTGLCVADTCMAWTSEDDENGHCELIHGISGWISRIANRMPS